jgi:hypothetical protein
MACVDGVSALQNPGVAEVGSGSMLLKKSAACHRRATIES